MVWDATMLGAAKAYAEANQAVLITPFILAGAMSPATVGARRPRRSPRRSRGWRLPARPARRPGHPRLVRFLDVDAVRRPDVRHARAGAGPLRDGRARAAARCPVPLRRGADRVEDRGRPGRVRVGEHDAADDARRGQLRPHTAGWLEGGLSMGYEKFILDVDQPAAWHAFAKGAT